MWRLYWISKEEVLPLAKKLKLSHCNPSIAPPHHLPLKQLLTVYDPFIPNKIQGKPLLPTESHSADGQEPELWRMLFN